MFVFMYIFVFWVSLWIYIYNDSKILEILHFMSYRNIIKNIDRIKTTKIPNNPVSKEWVLLAELYIEITFLDYGKSKQHAKDVQNNEKYIYICNCYDEAHHSLMILIPGI